MSRLIALLTDYGHRDAYVGILKGVINAIHPNAKVVDVCHDLPPQAIGAGCHLLSVSRRYFPDETVFVAIVDPGVGTRRRPIAVRTDRHFFVAPDNGLLSFLGRGEIVDARRLTDTRYFLKPVSATFHGRDIFAPVAARLAAGADVRDMGPAVKDIVRIDVPGPVRKGKTVKGRVVWIDRFGNLVTDIPREWVKGKVEVVVRGQVISGLCRTYGDRPKGSLVALIGSGDRLEVSLVQGSAAGALGCSIGDPILLHAP
jgi:S-adenosylmethionine hydrolase